MPRFIRSAIASHFLLFTAFAIIIMNGTSAFAANDAMDKSRLEKMLADSDTGMIVQIFKRHPGHTLPFIDSYLEGGLAMIEKGEMQPARARRSRASALQLSSPSSPMKPSAAMRSPITPTRLRVGAQASRRTFAKASGRTKQA